MKIKVWLRCLWIIRIIIKKLLFKKFFFLSFFIWCLIYFFLLDLWEEKIKKNIKEACMKEERMKEESIREKCMYEKRMKEKKSENKIIRFFNNNFKIKWKRVRIRKINLLKREFFTIKILLKRRNLFLTLIDCKGDIIMKTNLGASGYKKRNKFTGDSLEGTTLTFFKNVKEIVLKKLKIKKKVKACVTIYFKNCLKNWQYRFIKKGMWKARIFGKKVKLYGLNNFSYNSHSKGQRTKKKRRV